MSLTPFDDVWSTRRHFQDPMFHPMMTSRDWMTPYFNRRSDITTRASRNQRLVEMESKFDELVKKCDARFTGILGVLDEPISERQPVQVELEGKQVAVPKAENFTLKVDVQDFNPEEVKVKVHGGQVLIHAKRENKNEGEGMYAYSCREFRRAFTLPQGVNAEKLTSSLSSGGILQIDAPAVAAIESRKSVPVSVTVE